MRIAFFTDSYLPNVDGVVTTICNYRRELERLGHEVYIFSPGTKTQKDENKDERIYYFTSTTFKPYPDYRIAIFNFFSPVKLVKELGFDIIHSHGVATTGLAAIQSSQKLGIRAVASFHTFLPEAVHYISSNRNVQNILQGIATKYLSWYYSGYKKVIAPSIFAKKVLEGWGIKNVIVHPAGIELERFASALGTARSENSAAIRKEFGIPKSANVVLHVSRIAMEKNIEMLIEAASSIINLVPQTKFVIVGKGPAEAHYKNLVERKGLSQHFIFTGYVANEKLPLLYSTADVFAFPSAFETQGLVVLEAMACGTPAVVKAGGAASEFIVDGKNGCVFSDHFDFHDKIVFAMKNKQTLGKNAIETAQEYDIRKNTEKLVELYKSCIGNSGTK